MLCLIFIFRLQIVNTLMLQFYFIIFYLFTYFLFASCFNSLLKFELYSRYYFVGAKENSTVVL